MLWKSAFFAVVFCYCAWTPVRAKDENPASSERLREAWKQYGLGEFNTAIRYFQALQRNPGQEDIVQGLYGEAACWNFRRDARDPAKAVAAYEALLRRMPEHPLAPWAALDLVRARYLGRVDAFDQMPEAVRAYQEVWRKYPGTPAGEEAFLFQAGLRLQGLDAAGGEKLLGEIGQFLENHPESPLRSPLFQIESTCYELLGFPQQKMASLIRALETMEVEKGNPNAGAAQRYWTIAYTAEFEAGDFRTARAYYRRLLDEYPRDVRVFGAKRALLRMDEVEKALREGRPVPKKWLGEGR